MYNAMVKAVELPAHVTLCGTHIARLRGQLPSAPALFEVFDFARF